MGDKGRFPAAFLQPTSAGRDSWLTVAHLQHQLNRWTSRDSAQMSGWDCVRRGKHFPPIARRTSRSPSAARAAMMFRDVGAHTHAVNHPLSQSPHLPYASLIQTRHYVTVLNAHKSGRVQLPSFSGHVYVSAVRVALSSVCVCERGRECVCERMRFIVTVQENLVA